MGRVTQARSNCERGKREGEGALSYIALSSLSRETIANLSKLKVDRYVVAMLPHSIIKTTRFWHGEYRDTSLSKCATVLEACTIFEFVHFVFGRGYLSWVFIRPHSQPAIPRGRMF